MGPQLLIDKSALQSLSKEETFFLAKHYMVVVAPVLMSEILADFTKAGQAKKKRRSRLKNEAIELADKLNGVFDRCLSLPREALIIRELLDGSIEMRHRPHVAGTSVAIEKGERGFWVDSSHMEASLAWSEGRFTEAERVGAYSWRLSVATIDLERTRRMLLDRFGRRIRFHSVEDISGWIDGCATDPEGQVYLLGMLFTLSHAGAELRAHVTKRWERSGRPPISAFAPYGWHCMKTITLFQAALASGLVGTYPTNAIDIEYLFYLPFCVAFSSGDRVHDVLSPVLLDAEQTYIPREELKEDLRQIAAVLGAEADAKAKGSMYPPENPDSITHALWKRHMRPREGVEGKTVEMTPEIEAKIVQMLKGFREAKPSSK